MNTLQEYEARIAALARLDFTPDQEWTGPHFRGDNRADYLKQQAASQLGMIAAEIRRIAWQEPFRGWSREVASLAEQEMKRLNGNEWQAGQDRVMDRVREWLDLDPRPLTEIAAACQPPMSPAQLSQIKSGYRANPSLETIDRVRRALGRTWAELDPLPPEDQ